MVVSFEKLKRNTTKLQKNLCSNNNDNNEIQSYEQSLIYCQLRIALIFLFWKRVFKKINNI